MGGKKKRRKRKRKEEVKEEEEKTIGKYQLIRIKNIKVAEQGDNREEALRQNNDIITVENISNAISNQKIIQTLKSLTVFAGYIYRNPV